MEKFPKFCINATEMFHALQKVIKHSNIAFTSGTSVVKEFKGVIIEIQNICALFQNLTFGKHGVNRSFLLKLRLGLGFTLKGNI